MTGPSLRPWAFSLQVDGLERAHARFSSAQAAMQFAEAVARRNGGLPPWVKSSQVRSLRIARAEYLVRPVAAADEELLVSRP
jgi:hypothetical protein